MKSITYQQALVLIACLTAPILAYKLLSSVEAAGATAMVGMIVNFLLGRNDPPPPSDPPKGPSLKVVGFTTASLLCATVFVGCALFRGNVRHASYAAELTSCDLEAEPGVEGWATYTPCCIAVNARYPLPDGGKRDNSLCYPSGMAP